MEWINTLPCVKTINYTVSLRVHVNYCIRAETAYVYIAMATSYMDKDYLCITYDRTTHTYELSLNGVNNYSIDILQLNKATLDTLKAKLQNAIELYSVVEEIWQTGYHQEMVNLFDELTPNTVFK